jgi:hypothetical protein
MQRVQVRRKFYGKSKLLVLRIDDLPLLEKAVTM